MDALHNVFHEEPIGSFALLLAIILIVPPIFERLRLPGVLGLLAAGVALGDNGLGLLTVESPVMELLADVGLLYLMFVAGLEIDLPQLRKVKYRSASFGAFTFTLPLICGILIGRWFQFDWNAAILLGSLLASHSLMTYPIVRRLGVVANEAVTITIGATICTDIGALIVLAICLGIHIGGFSATKLVLLLVLLALYTFVVLIGLDRLGKAFFRRSGGDEGTQFLFILLAVFVAALGAQLIGVEKIVGAFLSGLAVNDVVGDGPVKEKVVFVGSVLFIPIFFVNIGLLMDLPAFLSSLSAFGLAVAIVLGLIGSKFLAALMAKVCFGYRWRVMITMWAMSIPQVATTLAATLVGNRVGMLSDDVLNSVVVMMLVTATLGPIIVSRAAAGLSIPEQSLKTEIKQFEEPSSIRQTTGLTVVVPVYNPQTEQHLIELAALLAKGGVIVPLGITLARPHMTRRKLKQAMNRTQNLLDKAEEFSQGLGVSVKPLLRIDDQVPQGICRASQEQRARLIVMGGATTTGLRARLFGNIIDNVFWAAPCPVAVARLTGPPREIHSLLVPVENFSQRGVRVVSFARLLAEAVEASVTLLHLAQQGESDEWLAAEMATLIERVHFNESVRTIILRGSDVIQEILREAQHHDLVVLHSQRHQVVAEGFGYSDITSQLVSQLTCATIVLGESHLT
ncbi:MAG: cation:proton antiporter [Leptolyngbyaceae bacterium]|nr:cation:proton antiporter [Leptolyngbyaceae bacterium]